MNHPPFLIYMVDDDEDDLLFIHNAFREIGLENVCKGFLQGTELLQHVKFTSETELPDLIVLDYEMPRMNGREVFRMIKNIEELEHVPVIFYSDKITYQLEQELMALGAYCCIKKGVTAGDQVKFAQKITEILKNKSH